MLRTLPDRHASQPLGHTGLATRCAWCERYRVANRWFTLDELPAFVAHAPATHGICDDCVDALREAGRSV